MAGRSRKPKQLTVGQLRSVRLFASLGISAAEIAERVGVRECDVADYYEAELEALEGGRPAYERLQLEARHLELLIADAIELRDKYRALLPDKVSRNGQQEKHLRFLGLAADADERVARLHDRLARVLDQLAKCDGSYREGGSTDYLPPHIDIRVGDERGDVPVRSDERVSEDDDE